MTAATSTTNGASLEDCHTNFFSLVSSGLTDLSVTLLLPFTPPLQFKNT